MYRTCLFCHHRFGGNALIEHFPIGRKLAFDQRRGRLWVVCLACRGWNLTPLEERWEAIEECERAFRASPLRASTDEIGLARTPEGLELVRVGNPLRPEFAGWRFGDQLRMRHRRAKAMSGVGLALGGGALAAGTLVPLGALVAAVTVFAFPVVPIMDHVLDKVEDRERVIARVRVGGKPRDVRPGDVHRLELLAVQGEAWRLLVAHRAGTAEIEGAAATQTASQLFARVNTAGASRDELGRAVELIATHGGPTGFAQFAARVREKRRKTREIWARHIGTLGLNPVERIALEIAAHEDAERLALEGELQALEDAWRDAEEIAAISDNLFIPQWIMDAIRGKRSTDSGAGPA